MALAPRPALAPLFLVALAACAGHGDSDSAADTATTEPPPLGDPIDAPAGQWTFVDFPDSACDDGSPTGIGVNPGTTNDVLVFFNGGGACWDYTTCFTVNTAAHGPFGASDMASIAPRLGGTVFDRDEPSNPFKDWTFVFVPYCTGDIHGGSQVVTYTSGSDSRQYHHVGHLNALAYLKRMGATWTAPEKVVVSGASAGGGGTLLNYASFRNYWPDTEMYLVDDSLPLLERDEIPDWLRATWIDTWGLQPLMDEVDCPECGDDMSQVHVKLAQRWPDDRMALLSSEQDATISSYYLMSGDRFEEDLGALDVDVLQPNGWERFFVDGDSHTMLAEPGRFDASGTGLWSWLSAMATDDPAWTSVGP